jgi:sulfate-transporting ATPase
VTEFIQFAILGLGIGAVYTLLGQGIVLIYRGSGVVNFAHGTFAMAGAYTFAEINGTGVGLGVSLLAAIGVGAALGVLTQNLVMRPLRNAAPITRIIGTLGVLIVLQAGFVLHYGGTLGFVGQFLPQHLLHVGSIRIQADRVELFGIAVAITIVLSVVQRRSRLGLATSAAAENERAASSLGWSPNVLATVNWALGGALAGAAGALIAPLTGLLVGNLALLVVPALAAALLGGFSSYFGTLLGATAIGITQSLFVRYVTQPGAADAVPFLVIIIVLVVTGRSLPLRSHVAQRLPSLGRGAIRPVPAAAAAILGICLMLWVFPVDWQDAFTVSIAVAVMLLSIVVVTGYAGQISLAQYAMGGMGAYIAGRLVATQGWPFWLSSLIGIVAAVPIGLAFGLPALRTRGVNLAVVTLGLGLATSRMLFENVEYTGGFQGTTVGEVHLFGLNINAIDYPGRYGVFCLVAFVVAGLAVANLRRSRVGRRLIAIRANERAAASLGVSVVGAKLYAFAVASAIAALAGILIGFRSTSVIYTNFDPFQSIYAIAYAVIGGIGYVFGPLLGSTLTAGGIGTLFNPLLSGIDTYLVLIGGVVVILMLIANPDGMVSATLAQFRVFGRMMPGPVRRLGPAVSKLIAPLPARDMSSVAVRERERAVPKELEVDGLTVRFGGVVAVDGVSLKVAPGEIIGLIGPNGAGKTTLIDAVTGFVRPAAGQIRLGGETLTRAPAHRRARAGIGRSWQSLELFEDVDVFENLQIASDRITWIDNLTALVRPGRARLSPSAAAAIRDFALADDLERLPEDLPYGRRRLVGIARAVALNPSILLLDEPAAGLSDTESGELAQLLRRLASEWGMGILLIEHDVDLVLGVCDRIVVLDFGKQIATGTPAEIRTDPAVVRAYLGEDQDGDATAEGTAEASEPALSE